MSESSVVRMAIIGLGNMGSAHARSLVENKIPGAVLAAVSDLDEAAGKAFPGIPIYTDAIGMMDSGAIDAVLIATPHYDHTTLGMAALQRGLHTLVEKPISVHKADCERLLAAHTDRSVVFAAMFNQRTDPFWRKIHDLVHSGELGEVRRINWIITNWFRSDAYYLSGGWRATWSGEGGGVLLNQCPHNLDLWQWMFGMPERVWADCQLGRHHPIEVEDEVTAYLKYANGATGVFITSTGEAPGTNRLEVSAERGKLVYENGRIEWIRNEVEASVFCKETAGAFSTPPTWDISFPLDPSNHGTQHVGIIRNFVDAIREGTELVAPAHEGAASVELANAMLQSSAENRWVDLPLDGGQYEALLKKRIAESTFVKAETKRPSADDFSQSFNS